MTKEPSIKEALVRAIAAYNEVWNGWSELDASNVDECREEAMKAALATLSPPAGERLDSRAAFEKVLANRPWLTYEETDKDRAFRWWSEGAIFASGLVQDEAGWRDSGTIPMDGTNVLIAEDRRGSSGEAYYDAEEGRWYWANTGRGDYPTPHEPLPTHWQPLPAPPIRSARDGGAES